MQSLKNRVAIITGATAGIGRAIAADLAERGAAVVLMGRRQALLEAFAAELQARGAQALAVEGDAAKVEDIERLLASDEAQWREMYEINVLGAAALMRRVGTIMVQQESGDIVALGSTAGHNVSPFSGFYGSTKFALAGMVEAFRREVCARGVRVTLIMPGIVESEFQRVAGYTPDNFFKAVERFGTLLAPRDVAAAVTFVVSQPSHVHVNELVIRPTKQDYP